MFGKVNDNVNQEHDYFFICMKWCMSKKQCLEKLMTMLVKNMITFKKTQVEKLMIMLVKNMITSQKKNTIKIKIRRALNR